MDIVSTLSTSFFSGITILLNWINENLGQKGILGFLTGVVVMIFVNTLQRNLFKLIVIVLVIILVLGLSYSINNPDVATQGLEVAQTYFNSSFANSTG